MKRKRESKNVYESTDDDIEEEPPKKKTDDPKKQIIMQEKLFYDKTYQETTNKNQETIKSLMSIYEKSQGLRYTYNMDIEIPEMVIVGPQSVGKSSFVNALLGRQFNMVKNEIGTICPIIIRMENDPTCEEPFCMFFKDEYPDQLEDKETPIDEVKYEIDKRSKKRQNKEKSKISAKPIILKIKYKECVNIVVYDTPGFRRRDVKDLGDDDFDDENISEKIEEMVMDIISSKNKTIVALQQSSTEWCDMDVIEKIKKVDLKLDRTIMIVTKFDQRSSGFLDKSSAQKYILNGINSLQIKEDRFFLVSFPFKQKTVNFTPNEYIEAMRNAYLKDMLKMRMNECDESHGINQIGFVRAREYLQNHMIQQYKQNLHLMHDKFCEIIIAEEKKLEESEFKLKQIAKVNVKQLVLFNLSLFCSNMKHVLDGDIHFKGIDCDLTNNNYKIDIDSIGMTSSNEWKKYLEKNNNHVFSKRNSFEKMLWCDDIWKESSSPIDPIRKLESEKKKSRKPIPKKIYNESSSDESSDDEKKTTPMVEKEDDDFSDILDDIEEDEPKPKSKKEKHTSSSSKDISIDMNQVSKKFEKLKIKMSDQSIYGNNQFQRLLRECSLVIRSKIFPMSSTREFDTIIPFSVHNHDLFEIKHVENQINFGSNTKNKALENETKRIEQMKKFDPYICKIVQSKSKKCLMPVVEIFVSRLEFLIDHTIDVNMKFLNFYLDKKDVFMSHYSNSSNKESSSWDQTFIYQTTDLVSLIMRHDKDEKISDVFNKHLKLQNVYSYFSQCVKDYKIKILSKMKDHMQNELEKMVHSLHDIIQINPRTIQPYIGKTDDSILYYMKWKETESQKTSNSFVENINSFLVEYVHHMNFLSNEPMKPDSSFVFYKKYFDGNIKQKPSISDHDQYILGNCHMVFEYVKNEFINQMINCYRNMVIDKMNNDLIEWLKNQIAMDYSDEMYEDMLGIEKKEIERQLKESREKIQKLKIERAKMNHQFVQHKI